jgi:hypothetical protein
MFVVEEIWVIIHNFFFYKQGGHSAGKLYAEPLNQNFKAPCLAKRLQQEQVFYT